MWRVLKRVLWSCEFHTSKTNGGFLLFRRVFSVSGGQIKLDLEVVSNLI